MKLTRKPESQAHPENRNGTRTHRAYMSQYLGCNAARRAILFATPRQVSKARKAWLQGLSVVPGRVANACLQEFLQGEANHAEDLAYGVWGNAESQTN